MTSAPRLDRPGQADYTSPMLSAAGTILLSLALTCRATWFGHKSRPESGADRDYVMALSAADRFLKDWQNYDADDGMALISVRLKAKLAQDVLLKFLSGGENPGHQAFELGQGKKLGGGRYSFEVRLYEHRTGEGWEGMKAKSRKLVLARESPDIWLVDELP